MTEGRLRDLLALADQTICNLHGCFPADRTNDRQRRLNDAMRAIRQVTGDDYSARQRAAERALEQTKS